VTFVLAQHTIGTQGGDAAIEALLEVAVVILPGKVGALDARR